MSIGVSDCFMLVLLCCCCMCDQSHAENITLAIENRKLEKASNGH